MKNTLILATFGLALLTISCEKPQIIEKSVLVSSLLINGEDTIADGTVSSYNSAHTGNRGYRTDSLVMYSGGGIIELNDTLIGKELRVLVDFWARSTQPLKSDGLAISLANKEGGVLFWGQFDPLNYGGKVNEWVHIVDSVNIPAEKNYTKGSVVKIFGYNPNKIAKVDFDDINVNLKLIQHIEE